MKEVLDAGLLGYYIRAARIESGYDKAEDFAEAISKRTGYKVSKQTIYNIESGNQEPKLSLYLAIMRVLRADEAPVIDQIVLKSLPPAWRLSLAVEESIRSQVKDEKSFEALAGACSGVTAMVYEAFGASQELLADTFLQDMQNTSQPINDALEKSLRNATPDMTRLSERILKHFAQSIMKDETGDEFSSSGEN